MTKHDDRVPLVVSEISGLNDPMAAGAGG